MTATRTLYLTPKEYAVVLGVTVGTVWRWIKAGKLETKQISGPRGRHFIRRELLEGEYGKPRN